MSALEPSPSDRFTLDARQREILELLALIGPELVAYFSDCCRVMSGAAGVVAQTHLAAHLLREIEGRLHEVFEPMLSRAARGRIGDAGSDKQSHPTRIREAATILELDEPLTEQWLEYGPELHRFAHRFSLSGPRDIAEFKAHFDLGQGVLLAVLRRYRAIYTGARPTLLELAGTRNPTDGHLRRLRRRVPHSTVALGEFFQLADTGWFNLLQPAGYFDDPPTLEVDEEGRVAYVEWPAARFLVRAAADPDLQSRVVEIFADLETNNPEARDAAVEVVLSVPATLAATLVDRIGGYLRDSEFWWVPRRSEELIDHLLAGGEVEGALALTKELIAAAPRGVDWRTRIALSNIVPKLFPLTGLEGLRVLRDALADELAEEGRTGSADYSTIWRPAIADGRDYRRRDLLVTALAASAFAVATNDPGAFDEVLELVSEPPQPIFVRIALHVLAQHPIRNIAAGWLGNEELFRNHNCQREYDELAAAAFAGLDTTAKERIFSWIDAGPDWRPRDLPKNEVATFDARWRLRQLRRLSDLPDERRGEYEALVARFGEPGDPLAPSERAIWSGTTSPKTKEDLLGLDDAELLEFVASWGPGDDWRGPSVEGLAQELKGAAVAEPSRFAGLVPALQETRPVYVRAVLSGLDETVEQSGDFPLEPVLRFVHDVKRLGAENDAQEHDEDLENGWQPVRRSLAHLLLNVVEHDQFAPGKEEKLLAAIAVLAEDQDPQPDEEARRASDGLGPSFGAINSTRGLALHAAIALAWRSGKDGDHSDPTRRLPDDLRAVLERHLGPDQEPSLAVHSVFGAHFNQLFSLDQSWTTEKSPMIFPDGPGDEDRRDAAWQSYIDRSHVWVTSWPLLESEYRRVVAELGGYDPEAEAEVTFYDPIGRLLFHLLEAYLRDLVELSEQSILGLFFATAPANLRTAFIDLIGNDLSGHETASSETIERLQRFWMWRSELAIAEGNVSELSGFASWFGSEKLPERWALGQLVRVLEAGAAPTFDYAVTHRLPDLIEGELPLVMRVVELLVERAYTPMMVIGARDEFRAVLAAALASGNDNLVREARETISRLYAQRHTEFNDLL